MLAGPFIAILAILISATNGVPYSKYGRSCKDIGCLSNEVCIMAEDPCTLYQRDSCGRYPTCQKMSNGGESCTTKICPSGQYCKTENGRPTCVNTTPGLGYNSAGISSVNGQPTQTNHQQPHVPADPSNGGFQNANNPYENASAPAAEDVNHNHSQTLMPTRTPYVDNNSGYPPYPTNNNGHMPQPYKPNTGATDQYGYPLSTRQPDNRYHNSYPQHNLPQHSPGQGNTKPNSKKRNGASFNYLSMSVFIGSFVISILNIKMLKA